MRLICGDILFFSDFDSGNLARVEYGCPPVANGETDDPNGAKNLIFAESPSQQVTQTGKYGDGEKEKTPGKYGDGEKEKTARKSSWGNEICPSANDLVEDRKSVLEFQVWTRPDCSGTAFETNHRSWFYFGMMGGPPGAAVRIHVMNLNQQTRLFSQGMSPVYRVVPGLDKWEHLPQKCTYKSRSDGNFILTLDHTLPQDVGATVFLAFTFPFSYADSQRFLDRIDRRMGSIPPPGPDGILDATSIYYRRELLCHSLEDHRVELLTVTSYHGMTDRREPRLPHLFPDGSSPRSHIFEGKKIVFVSSRVHPGETPSSFVFNGLLQFLLSTSDPRAAVLRRKYVFKLVPMLNPDGVAAGHYRADSRGVNLNRTYLTATFDCYPSVFAARSLLLYYHADYSRPSEVSQTSLGVEAAEQTACLISVFGPEVTVSNSQSSVDLPRTEILQEKEDMSWKSEILVNSNSHSPEPCSATCLPTHKPTSDLWTVLLNHSSSVTGEGKEPVTLKPAVEAETLQKCNLPDLPCRTDPSDASKHPCSTVEASLLESRLLNVKVCADSSSSHCHRSEPNLLENGEDLPFLKLQDQSQLCVPSMETEHSAFNSEGEYSDAEELSRSVGQQPQLKNVGELPGGMRGRRPVAEYSGIAFYIDLHGHASKRGCFLYGNDFACPVLKVESMMLAKLMALNCPHFDFSSCNFSEQNMYGTGKHSGQSKEGSGRVALYTLTGLLHSYTVECSYNTGRLVHSLPMVSNGEGIVTPPLRSWTPPKYTPAIYHQVGRALGVSILDMTSDNPLSRLPQTVFNNIRGVKEWIRAFICPERPKHVSASSGSLTGNSPSKASSRNMAPFRRGHGRTVSVPSRKPSHHTAECNVINPDLGASCTLGRASSDDDRRSQQASSRGRNAQSGSSKSLDDLHRRERSAKNVFTAWNRRCRLAKDQKQTTVSTRAAKVQDSLDEPNGSSRFQMVSKSILHVRQCNMAKCKRQHSSAKAIASKTLFKPGHETAETVHSGLGRPSRNPTVTVCPKRRPDCRIPECMEEAPHEKLDNTGGHKKEDQRRRSKSMADSTHGRTRADARTSSVQLLYSSKTDSAMSKPACYTSSTRWSLPYTAAKSVSAFSAKVTINKPGEKLATARGPTKKSSRPVLPVKSPSCLCISDVEKKPTFLESGCKCPKGIGRSQSAIVERNH